MSHSHEHHHHETDSINDSTLLGAVVVNLGLSVFEFIAGLISGSTALMADALHNTNDAAALLIAYIARKVSKKGADQRFNFGYGRAELVGAMIQLTSLVIVGVFLLTEAVGKFIDPQPIMGSWMMIASIVALIVDLATVFLLWAMSKGSLNVKAAFLHNLTDAGASVAVLFGGAAVYWMNWTWVDPLLTLSIAGYIIWMSAGMLKHTSRILMNGAPEGNSVAEMRESIESIAGVQEVVSIQVWSHDEHELQLQARIRLETAEFQNSDQLRRIKSMLEERFKISESTIEMHH